MFPCAGPSKYLIGFWLERIFDVCYPVLRELSGEETMDENTGPPPPLFLYEAILLTRKRPTLKLYSKIQEVGDREDSGRRSRA